MLHAEKLIISHSVPHNTILTDFDCYSTHNKWLELPRTCYLSTLCNQLSIQSSINVRHYRLSAKSVKIFFVVSYARNSDPVAGKVRTNVGPRPLYKALGPGKWKIRKHLNNWRQLSVNHYQSKGFASYFAFPRCMLGVWVQTNTQREWVSVNLCAKQTLSDYNITLCRNKQIRALNNTVRKQ